MQLAQQQLRRKLKAVRRLASRSVLHVGNVTRYSKIGGLQLSCELVDMRMESQVGL